MLLFSVCPRQRQSPIVSLTQTYLYSVCYVYRHGSETRKTQVGSGSSEYLPSNSQGTLSLPFFCSNLICNCCRFPRNKVVSWKTLANTTVSIQRGTDHCNAVYLDWHRRIQPRSELHSFKKAHVNTERERERKYTLICLLKARSFTDVNIFTFALASESTWRHLPNKNAHQYTRAHIFIFIYAYAGTRTNI